MASFREDSIRSRDSGWFACAYAFLNGAWDMLRDNVAYGTYAIISIALCLERTLVHRVNAP
jgi:hypothetical protein